MEEAENKPFAEIIESNNNKYLAQTWDPKFSPKFGNLIQTNSNNIKIFGIITSIQTGSQDPMRYPFTYKKTEEELLKDQPQIFEFLKTTFDVQIVGHQLIGHQLTGHQSSEKILYSLPSIPPKIHSFVKNADSQATKNFFSKTNFLPLLFNSKITNLDELLLAIIDNIQPTKNFLEKFCSNFSLLSGNDYKRLKLFLKRIQ